MRNISLNIFQRSLLLDDEQKDELNLLVATGSFCRTCGDMCKKGVKIQNYYLNRQNNILVEGNCNICNTPIKRVVEFGEDPEFYDKAMELRLSLGEV